MLATSFLNERRSPLKAVPTMGPNLTFTIPNSQFPDSQLYQANFL
jgi:hypothetical protein